MDAADVVEISPPVHLLEKQKKRGAILHDVIDIDDEGGSKDLVIIGEKIRKSKKGKTIEPRHQVVEVSDYTFFQSGVEDFGPAILPDVIDIDYEDDSDDLVIIGEKVTKTNNGTTTEAIHHVTDWDNVNKHPEMEAPFTWLPEYDLGLKKCTSKAKISHTTDFSQLSWSLEPNNSKIQGSIMGSSNFLIKMDNVDNSCGTGLSSSELFSQYGLDLSLGVESSESKMIVGSFYNKMKSAGNLSPSPAIKFLKNPNASCNRHHAIMRKFRNFKQFDSVKDASDHHYFSKNTSMKQHPKKWVKVIQKEWKVLQNDLPDSIFVRVYDSRIDLLRAVIVGVEGTPYHNGLFFFDIYFPDSYPNEPPMVHSYADLVFNPHFKGTICLSLFNTTYASTKYEGWLPGVSTILQALVSLQGLVLNAKPFFLLGTEEVMRRGRFDIESVSLLYNVNVFARVLKMTSGMMMSPPKYFENFVVGHWVSRAHDIMRACIGFLADASLVKYEGMAFGSISSCAWTVHWEMINLCRQFIGNGVKDCEKYLSTASIIEEQLIEKEMSKREREKMS